MELELWILRVDVVPRGAKFPLLSHVFFGDSKESVDASLVSHMKDDLFLKTCYEKGSYGDFLVNIVKKYERPLSEPKRKAS